MPARYHKSRPKHDAELVAREAAERAGYPVLIELAFERYNPAGTPEMMQQAFVQVLHIFIRVCDRSTALILICI